MSRRGKTELHDQLYRYAEDLSKLVVDRQRLEEQNSALRDACARLGDSCRAFSEIFAHSRDIHIVTDLEGRILRSNPAAGALATASTLTGCLLRDWVVAADQDRFDALLKEAKDGGKFEMAAELRFCRHGEEIPLNVDVQVSLVSATGGPMFWQLCDIADRHEQAFESRLSSMVFEHAAEAIMITDVNAEILAVNPAFTRITGYTRQEAVGCKPSLLRSGLHGQDFYEEMWHSLLQHGCWQGEIRNRRKSGEIYPEWLNINAMPNTHGRVVSYVAVFSDMSSLLRTHEEMVRLAHHDSLTGLPNRLLFQDRLAQAQALARRKHGSFTLIFIDLDRFKPINDSHGHEVGDVVLKQAATRLAGVARETDTVARLGGDEFVIIASELAGRGAIDQYCGRIVGAMQPAIRVGDLEFQIGASLGCASFPEHASNDVELIKLADAAMYRAKAAGGARWAVHEYDGIEAPRPDEEAPPVSHRSRNSSALSPVDQLNALFALSSDGFVFFDGERRVQYASPAFESMTGWASADIEGMDETAFSLRLAAACAEHARFPGVAALRAIELNARASGAKGQCLIELLPPFYRILDVGVRQSSASGKVQFLHFRDVTREMEISQMKSEFLATAAHELRTPMATIYGFSELMLRQEFPAQERLQFIEAIYRQSGFMVAIINELLDLARIEAGGGKDFKFESLDLGQLVGDYLHGFNPPGNRPPPQWQEPPAQLARVRADSRKLLQALGNVVSNAYKYSPDGGAVELSLVRQAATDGRPAAVGIEVRDHGIGMTPEQLGSVCRRFYRVDTSGKIPGTGLGMSIVEEIIELHGGWLDMSSRLGSGSRIRLMLPVLDTPEEGGP